jgi:ammonia channel protein AmtB
MADTAQVVEEVMDRVPLEVMDQMVVAVLSQVVTAGLAHIMDLVVEVRMEDEQQGRGRFGAGL